MPDPFWDICDDHFVFPEELGTIQSNAGRDLACRLADIDNGLQVFLRGSQLESAEPFHRADIDLLVVCDEREQLRVLHDRLPDGLVLDINVIYRSDPAVDPVLRALLECRSVQLCGPMRRRTLIRANKLFAWHHWTKYSPFLIPDHIDTDSFAALPYFKMLTRCFGVLTYLRDRRFTRDVTTCIHAAHEISNDAGTCLFSFRESLEQGHAATFDVAAVKRLVRTRFDDWAAVW